MQLEIQQLLHLHGLDHVKEYLKLEVKEKGDLVLLKYNQIEADWTKTALYDCRGLILDRANGWKIVAFPYRKFFNLGEGYAAKIDWSNAVVYDKCDGSLITCWNYKGEWRLSTSGTIDAESSANGGDCTFADLVWKTVAIMYGSKEAFIAKLNPDYNYMFELMTPFNIVVTQHPDYRLLLHGVRDMNTLKELHIHNIDLQQVRIHDLKDVDDITKSFNDMTWQEEGYIVMDKHTMDRVKIKNPAYVAAHHVCTGLSPYHILSVVKNNELDEFLVYFPTRTDELNGLQELYDNLLNKLTVIFDDVFKPLVETLSDKEYAAKVFEVCNAENIKNFSGLFFQLKKSNTTVREYVNNISDRDLFHILKNGQ